MELVPCQDSRLIVKADLPRQPIDRKSGSVIYRRRRRHVARRRGGGRPWNKIDFGFGLRRIGRRRRILARARRRYFVARNIYGFGARKFRGPRPRQRRRECASRVSGVRNRPRRDQTRQRQPSPLRNRSLGSRLGGGSGAGGMRNLRLARCGRQQQEANKSRRGPVCCYAHRILSAAPTNGSYFNPSGHESHNLSGGIAALRCGGWAKIKVFWRSAAGSGGANPP
jgi:hypothetical protein